MLSEPTQPTSLCQPCGKSTPRLRPETLTTRPPPAAALCRNPRSPSTTPLAPTSIRCSRHRGRLTSNGYRGSTSAEAGGDTWAKPEDGSDGADGATGAAERDLARAATATEGHGGREGEDVVAGAEQLARHILVAARRGVARTGTGLRECPGGLPPSHFVQAGRSWGRALQPQVRSKVAQNLGPLKARISKMLGARAKKPMYEVPNNSRRARPDRLGAPTIGFATQSAHFTPRVRAT